MNGRQLVLVFLGALVVGAGAGFAASLAGSPAGANDGTGDLRTEIAGLTTELRAVRAELKSSERDRGHLTDRLTRTEARLAEIEGLPAAARREQAAVDGSAGESADPATEAAEARAAMEERIAALKGKLEGKVLATRSPETAARIERIRLASKLRHLPEDQRWAQAQEELSLSASQVADLKDALAVRNARIEEGKSVTESELPNGGSYKMVKLDPEAVAAAQTEYDERLDRILGRDQKEAWNDKGFADAFGPRAGRSVSLSSAGGGSPAIIQINTVDTVESK